MLDESLISRLCRRVAREAVNSDPWPHFHDSSFIEETLARRLSCEFPSHAAPAKRESGDKTYRFATARIRPDTALTGTWATMVGAMLSSNYRSHLETVFEVDLSTAYPAVDIWEYNYGDWLGRHIDKPAKALTQIVYLSDSWRPGDGGRLRLFRSASDVLPVRIYSPILGSTCIFVPSASSWHEVEKGLSVSRPRRTLTLTFWYR